MFARQFLRISALTLALLASSLPAQAGQLVDMEIVNRNSGETLASYPHRGQHFVAGKPGDRYAVRLSNRSDQRVLVVLSVDGVNVVSGETAASNQSGYVLAPWEQTEIAGWRKSQQDVAQFYFTALPDSYAVRTGRPDNVGVIGAAVFREKVYRPIPVTPYLSPMAPAASAGNRAAEAADSLSAESASPSAQTMRKSERLGTGHGQPEYAPIQYTEFERASRTPSEVLSLRYDSRNNLVSRGILPKPRPIGWQPNWRQPDWRQAQPFPGEFVPDPS
jgi:hypothetical protein